MGKPFNYLQLILTFLKLIFKTNKTFSSSELNVMTIIKSIQLILSLQGIFILSLLIVIVITYKYNLFLVFRQNSQLLNLSLISSYLFLPELGLFGALRSLFSYIDFSFLILLCVPQIFLRTSENQKNFQN